MTNRQLLGFVLLATCMAIASGLQAIHPHGWRYTEFINAGSFIGAALLAPDRRLSWGGAGAAAVALVFGINNSRGPIVVVFYVFVAIVAIIYTIWKKHQRCSTDIP